MKYELPPQEVIRQQIIMQNRSLEGFALRARHETGFTLLERPVDIYTIAPGCTTAGFWKHHIGSEFRGVQVGYFLQQEDPTYQMEPIMVRNNQQKAHALVRAWKDNPDNPNTPLHTASVDAFLKANSAIDWAVHSKLFLDLDELVSSLGNSYNMLEGNLPLHQIIHNLRQDGAI